MFKKSYIIVFSFLLAFGAFFYLFSEQDQRPPDSKNRNIIRGKAHFKKSTGKETELTKYLEKQWALQDIGVVKAWKETKGTSDIVVAVCDTGIHKQHPCLKQSLWTNTKEIPNNNFDDDKNGYPDDIHGWNFVNNNDDIQDRHGHGTHISGLIAATGRTKQAPECQMIGVAPKVKIMTLKYYDSSSSENNVKNTVKCIDYAVNNGAHIINYSGGGPGSNESEKASISKANDRGILFIAASGNESSEIEKHSKYYPASYNLPNIISVNSKSSEDKILESSNWVKMEWLKKERIHNQTAPGERIRSTLPPRRYLQSSLFSDMFRGLASLAERSLPETLLNYLPEKLSRELAREKVNHNTYGYMTGTSQATGITTGVAALIKSLYPHWSHLQIVNQIDKTGFSGSVHNIKQKTNQGKSLNAHEAITMRDRNFTPTDTNLPAGGNIGDIGPDSPLKEKDKREQDPLFDVQNFLQKNKSK